MTQARIMLAALLLASCLLPWMAPAALAEPGRMVIIGSISHAWGPTAGIVGLRDGLVELGYREDVDFVIGTRFTSGKTVDLDLAAKQLVEFGAEIIFAGGPNEAAAAQRITSTIPIVFAGVSDPVRTGLVTSYAHPGANITGVADGNARLAPKRLEIFKKMVPNLKRVLFIYDGHDPYSEQLARVYRDAAARLGITVLIRAVQTEAEAEAILASTGKGDVDGILAPQNVLLNIPGAVVETAPRKGIPTMFPGDFWLPLGGLASFGSSFNSSGRLAARAVDKIIKGAKPADIPVENNSEFEFIVNLKAARALGLEIDPEVLYMANNILR